MSRDHYNVATMLPAQKGKNTLVLSGVDLVVPVEMDLDEDPLQDDEVRLVRSDGHFERVLTASDADATREEDGERLLYRFRDVPPGVYAVQARIHTHEWASIVEGIVVTTRAAKWNDEDLGGSPDAFVPTPGEAVAHEKIHVHEVQANPFYELAGDDTE